MNIKAPVPQELVAILVAREDVATVRMDVDRRQASERRPSDRRWGQRKPKVQEKLEGLRDPFLGRASRLRGT